MTHARANKRVSRLVMLLASTQTPHRLVSQPVTRGAPPSLQSCPRITSYEGYSSTRKKRGEFPAAFCSSSILSLDVHSLSVARAARTVAKRRSIRVAFNTPLAPRLQPNSIAGVTATPTNCCFLRCPYENVTTTTGASTSKNADSRTKALIVYSTLAENPVPPLDDDPADISAADTTSNARQAPDASVHGFVGATAVKGAAAAAKVYVVSFLLLFLSVRGKEIFMLFTRPLPLKALAASFRAMCPRIISSAVALAAKSAQTATQVWTTCYSSPHAGFFFLLAIYSVAMMMFLLNLETSSSTTSVTDAYAIDESPVLPNATCAPERIIAEDAQLKQKLVESLAREIEQRKLLEDMALTLYEHARTDMAALTNRFEKLLGDYDALIDTDRSDTMLMEGVNARVSAVDELDKRSVASLMREMTARKRAIEALVMRMEAMEVAARLASEKLEDM